MSSPCLPVFSLTGRYSRTEEFHLQHPLQLSAKGHIHETFKEEIAFGEVLKQVMHTTCSNTWPSGDIARYKTLIVCPVRVATYWESKGNRSKPENLYLYLLELCYILNCLQKQTFPIDGYFHTIIWFWEYPCVLTSSFTFLLHERLQTWTQNLTEFIKRLMKLRESILMTTHNLYKGKNLASSVNTLQLVAVCRIPEANASISSSTSRCKKAALVGRPSDGLNSSCVLS